MSARSGWLGFAVGALGALGLGLGVAAAPAEGQRFEASNGEVVFISRAPLQEFRGVSPHLTGQVDFATRQVSFFIDLETLDSGNRRRDRDMRRNYLETDRFPFATFNGTFPGALDPQTLVSDSVEVEGVFVLRDIEHPLTVRGQVQREGEGLRVRASWPLQLGDFGIERPRILFYEVSETLTLEIDILLRSVAPSQLALEKEKDAR
jgi:polyisoprenoid-binding protein YceI